MLRPYKIGMLPDVSNQPVLITAHFKKIVGLFDNLRLCIMIRTFALDKLPVGIKPFTPETVTTLIFAEINITLIVYSPEHLLHNGYMISIRCSNKVIVADIQFRPQIPELFADFVDIGPGTQVFIFGRADDLVAMLVRTGKEKGFRPSHGMKPADDICDNRCIGMTEVRSCIHIINGCRDIYRHRHGCTYSSGTISSRGTSTSEPPSIRMMT